MGKPFSGFVTLIAAATADTNPDPNGLATKDPQAEFAPTHNPKVSAAWAAQVASGKAPALLPTEATDRLCLALRPSDPALALTATLWGQVRGDLWLPIAGGRKAIAGPSVETFAVPSLIAVYLQLSGFSVANATVEVLYHPEFMRAA